MGQSKKEGAGPAPGAHRLTEGACGPKQKQTSGGAESRENFILKLLLSCHLEVIKILTLSA